MIKTIKLKDLIKYLVGLIIVILIAVCSTRFFSGFNKNNINISILNIDFKKVFESNIRIALFTSNEKRIEKEIHTARGGVSRILDLELPVINDNDETSKEVENKEEIKYESKTSQKQEEETQREVVQIKEAYTNSYGSVKIKNETDIKLTEEILKPDYEVKNYKDILIYHTHTCESYTQTNDNKYKASGNFRTTDLKYSVVRVGKELEKELKSLGFNVMRNETKHDYPAYSGSYERSLKTIKSMLNKIKNEAEIVFDIHRDAIGSSSNFAPTVEINGEKVAQLMFVIGTNDGGGKHPNWKNNLKFAVKVQEKANQMYPGLFRSINLRSATFNQKVTNAASIIEVGATGNTLEEATASMKYLAKVLEKVLDK